MNKQLPDNVRERIEQEAKAYGERTASGQFPMELTREKAVFHGAADFAAGATAEYLKGMEFAAGFVEWSMAKFIPHYRHSESGMYPTQFWWPRPMTLDKENIRHYTTSEVISLYQEHLNKKV